jgi:trans-aconitate methyltransferase
MDNSWKIIWNKRKLIQSENFSLDELIALDGFDTGAGKIKTQDWRSYTEKVALMLNLENGNSIYEVGCGSGAFLYALSEFINIEVGGNDYSQPLIQTAKMVFPGGNFECVEASEINTSKKYDFLISNSVFHYFDHQYARKAILKMIEKSNQKICILEIPNLQKKIEAEKIRRDQLSAEEYDKKYAGLSHTYYSKDWFLSIAKEFGLGCEIFDGCIPNYIQNDFRFGCILQK